MPLSSGALSADALSSCAVLALPPASGVALASFEEDMTRAAVQQLVSRLPESERALFSLRYFAGYNATELGDMFNLPPSTVRARLASARRKLSAWYYA